MVLGTFAGEPNAVQPVDQHPLGDILAQWAGLARSEMKTSSFVELRSLVCKAGELVMLFNHGSDPASVAYTRHLASMPRRIRELMTGSEVPAARDLDLQLSLPASSVRVYRIDY